MPPPYRRHSLATTPSMFPRHTSQNNYQLNDLLDKVHLDEQNNAGLTPDVLDTIQGYFENDRQRTQIFNDMGKGISLDQVPAAGAMYMVEFKAGRSDLYYVADKSTCSVKQGDLVIVEADRGKDLGKIILEDLTPEYVETLALQKEQQQQQQDGLGEDGQDSKELRPKQIYRKAVPAEVAMLLAKRQDEIKAVMVCQTKTRQKRLPMEVVDAEFQWDRRKLTFYFVAERRIDFRELVRDLFKTYKTRIWM
jgi:cell fate regulator YaaT (PSP1 superfamily)